MWHNPGGERCKAKATRLINPNSKNNNRHSKSPYYRTGRWCDPSHSIPWGVVGVTHWGSSDLGGYQRIQNTQTYTKGRGGNYVPAIPALPLVVSREKTGVGMTPCALLHTVASRSIRGFVNLHVSRFEIMPKSLAVTGYARLGPLHCRAVPCKAPLL